MEMTGSNVVSRASLSHGASSLQKNRVVRQCLVICCAFSDNMLTEDALRECIPYLDIAEKDYAALEMYRSLQDVQFLLAVVYDNLGMVEDRDKAAERHRDVGKLKEGAERKISEPWIIEVLDIVADVSAALASR